MHGGTSIAIGMVAVQKNRCAFDAVRANGHLAPNRLEDEA